VTEPAHEPATIRPIDAAEWRRWREVRLRMLRDESGSFGTRWEDAAREPDARWQDWAAEAARGETRTLFVAEADGRWLGVVGAFLRIDPREAQLISMWVDPAARGQQLAERLIVAVAEWASTRGCTHVYLFVQETNVRAQRVYERAGFAATGDRERMPRRRGFKLLYVAPVDALLRQAV
jgi:ribosomal protein S18 acetylase RimI-like enzyme